MQNNTLPDWMRSKAQRDSDIRAAARRDQIATATLFLVLALVLLGVAYGNGLNVAAGFNA